MQPPVHGGALGDLAVAMNRPITDFIDLSTGINPYLYPVDTLPASAWAKLPNLKDSEWHSATRAFYGSDNFTAVPGTQWAIHMLPMLLKSVAGNAAKKIRVGVPVEGYAEHAYHWQRAGAHCEFYQDFPNPSMIASCDVCVIVNPNNPTSYCIDREQVIVLHQQLQQRGAYLIIDEAFVDFDVDRSVSDLAGSQGLIVLRSFGKFSGLAGVRLGFVGADKTLRAELEKHLPIWSISGAAIELSTRVFRDRRWFQTMRDRVQSGVRRLAALLRKYCPDGELRICTLFCTVVTGQAGELHRALLELGVYVRLLDAGTGLRVGLPKDDECWNSLEHALRNASAQLGMNMHQISIEESL